MSESLNILVMIPIYNHGSTIEAVASDAMERDYDVMIVDDGCDEVTAKKLMNFASQHSQVTLIRHAVNQGKGAAFLSGLDHAHLLGYTHAILIDADGQHNLNDLQHFKENLEENPDAAVFGVPVFDHTAPAARKFGHQLTNFFINIETGGKVVGDALCGYRLYPIKSSLELMKHANIGRRMEFDPEIAVKMAWSGIPIINLNTKVIYTPGGISNFRVWADNVRISWMHTKLVTLSILRRLRSLPLSANDQHWSDLKEAGSPLGLELMRFILKYGGRHIAKFCLIFVVLYFFIFHAKSRKASKNFLEKVQMTPDGAQKLGTGPISLWMLWKHQWEFGASCLDRAICWSGQTDHFDIDWINYEEVYSKVKEGKGCILLGSHLGNVDILRAYSKKKNFVKLNVFMVKGQSKFFQNIIKKLNQNSDIEIIPIESINVTTSMMLKEKLDKGELIALLGDRVTNQEQFTVQEIPFLNEPATFPEGPYLLSHLLKCPIYTIFSVRTGSSRYKVQIEKLSDPIDVPRHERKESLTQLLKKYVTRLEEMAIRHPYQWFNFYNFWAKHH